MLRSWFAIALLCIACDAAHAGSKHNDPEPLILVTFPNVTAAAATPAGRPYRFRPRYRVSARAIQQARLLEGDYPITAVDNWPIRSLGVYCVVYRVTAESGVDALIRRMGNDPRVESVQSMKTFRTLTSVSTGYNDTYAGLQHGFDAMGVEQAHAHALGNGIRIAIVDTAVDTDHEDLEPRDIASTQFVGAPANSASLEHGTAVASIIAASANNGIGIAGVSPGADVTALGACTTIADGNVAECSTLSLAKALDHALEAPPDVSTSVSPGHMTHCSVGWCRK